jgi:hypothetical protein
MSQQWSELEAQVAASFLICQKATKNWNLLPGAYTLPPDPINVQEQNMDLFDITCKLFFPFFSTWWTNQQLLTRAN